MRSSPCRLSRAGAPQTRPTASPAPGGFTLMEVVVGLVLMASVLVGSLLAFSSHQKQLRHADSKLAAVEIADALLHRLSGSRGGIPASASGPIAGRPTWFWRTRRLGFAAPASVPVEVIRLEVIQSSTPSGDLPRVLARVDVVGAAS